MPDRQWPPGTDAKVPNRAPSWRPTRPHSESFSSSNCATSLTPDRTTGVIAGPVAAELLAGTPEPSADELWSLLRSLTWIHIGAADWHTVGVTAGRLRRAGTPVPLTDLVIAAAAVAAGAALWSRDADFHKIETALPQLSRFAPG